MGKDLSKGREARLKDTGPLSREQKAHLKEIGQIIGAHKTILKDKSELPTKKEVRELMRYIWQYCPCYPTFGSLNIDTWEKIGSYLHEEPRAPTPILISCKAVLTALCLHHGDTFTLSKKQADELTSLKPTAPPKYEEITTKAVGEEKRESKEEILKQTPQEEKSNTPEKSDIPPKYEEVTTEIVEKIKEEIKQQAPQEEKSNIYPVLRSTEYSLGPLTAGMQKKRSGEDVKLKDLKLMAAFPVDFTGQNPVFTPLPSSVLKDLSPYVQGLLQSLSENYVLLPNEWYSVAKILSTWQIITECLKTHEQAVMGGTDTPLLYSETSLLNSHSESKAFFFLVCMPLKLLNVTLLSVSQSGD
ncbi:uncharacterized protein LOC116519199 [Thamnophis elegans]|uniref:uncharacterized protein LOC116519199 n=1 Tax=Thamnophis elegans TaxID=35005 RepID=UPI001378CE2D|nr:uncharacterized protein LOC116519199 [Thamnophis elegans]